VVSAIPAGPVAVATAQPVTSSEPALRQTADAWPRRRALRPDAKRMRPPIRRAALLAVSGAHSGSVRIDSGTPASLKHISRDRECAIGRGHAGINGDVQQDLLDLGE
jgi:hypothetical protein